MKKLNRILFSAFVVLSLVAFSSPFNSFHGVLAEAENFDSDLGQYPYTENFIISAYYSPLPCQERYATGSYEADIRLNGRGTNGADGTEVYPGMIAAPKSYAFGTKMYIPGIGMVAVHDRGGAIVEAGVRNHAHDRLDVWMGYGDKGLRRALQWGKRTIAVTVYGVNDSLQEQVTIGDFDPSEAVPNDCDATEPLDEVNLAVNVETVEPEVVSADSIDLDEKFYSTLSRGLQGKSVMALQKQLAQLNFYRGEINGVFDEVTEHAVFKFQQSQGIVSAKGEVGSGVFGPQTRDRVNEIITSRNYRNILVAQKSVDTNIAADVTDVQVASFKEEEEDFSFSDGF